MTDQNDVRALLDVYSEAAYSRDVDRFVALFAEDVRIFDLWGTWEINGISEWRTSTEEWFASLGDDRVVVEFADVVVSVGGDLATVSAIGTYTAVSATGERLRHLSNRLTWVLTRTNGAWQVAHEHTSAPVNQLSGTVILARDA